MSHITQYTIENKNAHIFVISEQDSECYMLWDMGNVRCEICEIVQLSQNKIQCNSIMASPGLIYMHIYPPGDRGLMYILVY